MEEKKRVLLVDPTDRCLLAKGLATRLQEVGIEADICWGSKGADKLTQRNDYQTVVLLSGRGADAGWKHFKEGLSIPSVIVTFNPMAFAHLATYYIEKDKHWVENLIKFLTGAPRP